MSGQLIATVHVNGVRYRPGDKVPPDVAKLITNPKAWGTAAQSSDGDPSPSKGGASDSAPTPPPRSGKGSGVKEWRSYAERMDVAVPDDIDSRDGIIGLLEDRGVAVD